ncbi:Choline Transporter-Like Protein 2 [Manis pentadactyla]|nr:Choline Transporter-Like Protein 2 [Manis pentadactyla]
MSKACAGLQIQFTSAAAHENASNTGSYSPSSPARQLTRQCFPGAESASTTRSRILLGLRFLPACNFSFELADGVQPGIVPELEPGVQAYSMESIVMRGFDQFCVLWTWLLY